MSYTKTHDLVVKTGSYTDREGNEKGRYENVGMILTDGDAKLFLLKRTFNPAGVPNPDGKDSVIVSAFEVKERDERKAQKAKTNYEGATADLDDDQDLPF